MNIASPFMETMGRPGRIEKDEMARKHVLHFIQSMLGTAAVLCSLTADLPAQVATSQAAAIPSSSMQKVYVRLRLGGLYPKAMTLTEGTYQIVFSNATFLAPLDFELVDGQGKSVSQTSAGAKLTVSQQLKFDLKPGNHTLRVVGHPEWNTNLLVKAKGK